MSWKICDCASKTALDELYGRKEDPWETRLIPEKIVRYKEINKLLPRQPINLALEIACGEGDFSNSLSGKAKKVVATDISFEVLKRASKKYPKLIFLNADIKDLTAEFFAHFDLIIWLDAIYWLSRRESQEVLNKMSSASREHIIYFIFSGRIVFPDTNKNINHWPGHDFAASQEFIAHIREFFPLSKAVPVQLNLNIRSLQSLSFLQRISCFLLKIINHFKGYRLCLEFAKFAIHRRALYYLIEPFVVHIAVVVSNQEKEPLCKP